MTTSQPDTSLPPPRSPEAHAAYLAHANLMLDQLGGVVSGLLAVTMGVPAVDLRALVGDVASTARYRLDGEGFGDSGSASEDDRFILENDDAVDRYTEIVEGARALLGWKAGQPPLEDPEMYGDVNPCPSCGEPAAGTCLHCHPRQLPEGTTRP